MPSTVKITTLEQLKVALQAAKTYIDNEIGGLGGLALIICWLSAEFELYQME